MCALMFLQNITHFEWLITTAKWTLYTVRVDVHSEHHGDWFITHIAAKWTLSIMCALTYLQISVANDLSHNRITAAVETSTPDLLIRVWHELDGLSPRCVPYDERCTHRAIVGMYYKLVITLSFLLVFIILFTIVVKIKSKTAPIILTHAVFQLVFVI